jgi:hypothetical protein
MSFAYTPSPGDDKDRLKSLSQMLGGTETVTVNAGGTKKSKAGLAGLNLGVDGIVNDTFSPTISSFSTQAERVKC